MFGRETNDAFYAVRFLMVVVFSSVVGLTVMWLTRPEPLERLASFYRRVRPYGIWGPVRKGNEAYYHGENVGFLWLVVLGEIGLGLGGTFTILGLAFALWPMFWISLPVFSLSGLFLLYSLRKLYPEHYAELRRRRAERRAARTSG